MESKESHSTEDLLEILFPQCYNLRDFARKIRSGHQCCFRNTIAVQRVVDESKTRKKKVKHDNLGQMPLPFYQQLKTLFQLSQHEETKERNIVLSLFFGYRCQFVNAFGIPKGRIQKQQTTEVHCMQKTLLCHFKLQKVVQHYSM